jgi:hypothetical protein
MNLARALNEFAVCGASRCTDSNTTRTNDARHPAQAREDIYLPSDVAARLLPPDGYHDGERIVWDLTALGADRRSQAH